MVKREEMQDIVKEYIERGIVKDFKKKLIAGAF
jgi:hypothetical protein